MIKKLLTSALMLMLTLTATQAVAQVTLPDGVTPKEYTLDITHRIYQGEGESALTQKKITTLVAFDGQDVYISGLAYYFPAAYVKGTLADGKVTFPSGQFVGSDQYGNEYLTSYIIEDGKGVITDFVFLYDATDHSLVFDQSSYISETTEMNGGGLYTDIVDAVYTEGGLPPLVPVSVPANLTTADYLLTGIYMLNQKDEEGVPYIVEEPYELPLTIGFNGDDLYIQGLVENVAEGWAKATKNSSGRYIIPKGQYIGTTKAFNLVFDYFLAAVNRNNAMIDIQLTYDAAKDEFTSTQTVAVNSSADKTESYYWLKNITIKRVTEREATPAQPSFTFTSEPAPYGSTTWYYADIFIPLSDAEGNPMVADKLSYVFYNKVGNDVTPVTFLKKAYYMLEADITEIPYGYTDGLDIGLHTVYFEKMGEDYLKTWDALGLQTIYRGNGVEHRSDIFWYDLKSLWESMGIVTVDRDAAAKTTATYDLQGRRVADDTRGLVIRRVVRADGTIGTIKQLRR